MSYAITLTDGKSFDCEEGETILDAATRAHVPMPYSCKTGRCSACKTNVVSGSSRALGHEEGISSDQIAAGWILACIRTPCSDMTLEVDDLSGVELPESRTVPCKIHSLERVSEDVMRVRLRLPPTAGFSYVAGQYVDVIGKGGMRRSYSLATAPTHDELLELHIREVPNGEMSKYWFDDARVNDLLRMVGPLGTFFLRPGVAKDIVFLATGTGIAPVIAMLQSVQARNMGAYPGSISVYWGGRHLEDLYINPLPTGLTAKYVPVLSRAPVSWDGARGYVQDVMLRSEHVLDNTVVYACGSTEMIESARRALAARGLSERYFYSDAFVCSAAL